MRSLVLPNPEKFMPAKIGGVFILGKLATRLCLLDGLGLFAEADAAPSC